MAEAVNTFNYEASPTGSKFHGDDNFARFILGPFGSGKTTIGLVELLVRGLKQEPDHTGVRRTRALVVRNSYPQLRSTTIPSYLSWYRGIAKMTYGSPIKSVIEFSDIGDGTGMHQETYFIGLDNPEDAEKLMSLELSFAFLDEFIFIDEHILEVLSGRLGRYPEMRYGGPTWRGYWGASNPCPVEHWYYKLAEEKKPDEFSFYRQPPGLIYNASGELVTNPQAENLKYLPDRYYETQAIGKDDDYIQVYLMGQYGELRSGRPVYPSYDDKIHCSSNSIKPFSNTDIVIGIDIGLHGNAAVFTQLLSTGQMIVVDEILEEGLSVTEFVQNVLKPYIFRHYGGYNFSLVLDPAARNRSQSDKKSALDIFIENGLPAELAPTNEFLARKEAVVYFLTKKDGFYLDSKCKILRRGFLSQYKYEEVRNSKGRLKEKPEKNTYSHPHDALQYAASKYKHLKVRKKVKRNSISFQPATVAGY